jgi:hypothetical protein
MRTYRLAIAGMLMGSFAVLALPAANASVVPATC